MDMNRGYGNCKYEKNTDDKHPLNHVKYSNKNHHKVTVDDNDVFIRRTWKCCSTVNLLRFLLCLTLLLVCLLVIFITLYFLPTTNLENINGSTCITKECVQISAEIIDAMDDTVDPCEDFYQYACGGWLQKTQIPDSRIRFSRFEKLSEKNSLVLKQILEELSSGKRNASTPVLKKAATYYQSCMDEKSIVQVGDGPMKEMVRRLGSWPITDANFNGSKWDLMKALVDVHKNISKAAIFNVYVTSDIKNSNENILVFDQGGINLERESYLRNSSFHEKLRSAYKKMMKSIVIEMGANESSLFYIDRVFEFEVELAKLHMSVLERRNYGLIYNRMTLEELALKTEISLEWLTKFVDAIFVETGEKVPKSEEIVSLNTEYIKHAYKMFMELDPKIQSSYIIWNAVRVMASVVLGKYQDILNEYYITALGIKDREPRWVVCTRSTLKGFGNALARPFVEQVYDKTAKEMSTEMIQAIKGVFENNLDEMEWMDEKTKKYAKLKASKILDNIGYPDYILNNTALEIEYNGFEVIKGQHFMNVLGRRMFNNLKNYEKRGKPVDKSEWGIFPTTVNAYYSPTENKIGFPAGILQWPFYDKRAPRAVSYGAIGMVVGHEISHGFDDQGKDFTIEGNLDTWWTNQSTNEFKKRAQCFINQYSNFTLFGEKLNGQQTIGEDLADNGGLRQSLQAYRNWRNENGEEKMLPGLKLTPDQLYFLAFAQVWCTTYRVSAAVNQIENGVHSISNFRVIGTLQNSEEFSEAYQCPVGSTMNPPKKCRVW